MRKRRYRIVIVGWIFGMLVLVTACSENVTVHPGLVTMGVRGKLVVPSDKLNGQPFIIVRNHHFTWLDSTQHYSRISAAIKRPNELNEYEVRFGADVRQVDLFFVYRRHAGAAISFKRTIGVSEFERDVVFELDENWRNNYFVLLKPRLTEYLVESRFQMAENEQQFLVDWIDETEKLLSRDAENSEN